MEDGFVPHDTAVPYRHHHRAWHPCLLRIESASKTYCGRVVEIHVLVRVKNLRILQGGTQRPHDTAVAVAAAVGCEVTNHDRSAGPTRERAKQEERSENQRNVTENKSPSELAFYLESTKPNLIRCR